MPRPWRQWATQAQRLAGGTAHILSSPNPALLSFCASVPNIPAHRPPAGCCRYYGASGERRAQLPELQASAVDAACPLVAADPDEGVDEVLQLAAQPAVLALVDCCCGEEGMEVARGALAAAVEALPRAARFGLLSFGSQASSEPLSAVLCMAAAAAVAAAAAAAAACWHAAVGLLACSNRAALHSAHLAVAPGHASAAFCATPDLINPILRPAAAPSTTCAACAACRWAFTWRQATMPALCCMCLWVTARQLWKRQLRWVQCSPLSAAASRACWLP